MTDVRKINETLDSDETKTYPVESRSFDEQTKLETAIVGAEEQFETAINDVANLEQEVENDVELPETDRRELLFKIKGIKSGIQARWRIFLKPTARTPCDVRRLGDLTGMNCRTVC
ncbi:MAG: hypothetical protein V1716_01005 [Candidatus Uhrbacteria bacterium]